MRACACLFKTGVMTFLRMKTWSQHKRGFGMMPGILFIYLQHHHPKYSTAHLAQGVEREAGSSALWKWMVHLLSCPQPAGNHQDAWPVGAPPAVWFPHAAAQSQASAWHTKHPAVGAVSPGYWESEYGLLYFFVVGLCSDSVLVLMGAMLDVKMELSTFPLFTMESSLGWPAWEVSF